jgi:hypothetical protein
MSPSAISRRIADGRWLKYLPGVYRIAGAPEQWRTKLGALLWAGRDSAVAYRAAGALWSFDVVRPGGAELFMPEVRRSPVDWLHLHFNSSLPEDELRRIGPLTATSPARTILDLGAVLPPRTVELALEDAVRRKLTTFAELNEILERHAASGRDGAGVLRRLLDVRGPREIVPHSVFERKTIRLLNQAGLQEPVRQHLVFDADGYPFAQIDLAYPEILLGIEADSYGFHSGRDAWEANLERRNQLSLLGWYIIHVTWRQVTRRPDKVVAEVRRAISICNERRYARLIANKIG